MRFLAPFVLLPDMPTPETDSPAATLEVLAPVVVPSPEPLTTGRAWLDAVYANPFHSGLLSGLRNTSNPVRSVSQYRSFLQQPPRPPGDGPWMRSEPVS